MVIKSYKEGSKVNFSNIKFSEAGNWTITVAPDSTSTSGVNLKVNSAYSCTV
jgi:hypothetical protein